MQRLTTTTRKNRREKAGLNWSQVASLTGLSIGTVIRAEDPIKALTMRENTSVKIDTFYRELWIDLREEGNVDPATQSEIDFEQEIMQNHTDPVKSKFPIDYEETPDPEVKDVTKQETREEVELWKDVIKAYTASANSYDVQKGIKWADQVVEGFKKRFRS